MTTTSTLTQAEREVLLSYVQNHAEHLLHDLIDGVSIIVNNKTELNPRINSNTGANEITNDLRIKICDWAYETKRGIENLIHDSNKHSPTKKKLVKSSESSNPVRAATVTVGVKRGPKPASITNRKRTR